MVFQICFSPNVYFQIKEASWNSIGHSQVKCNTNDKSIFLLTKVISITLRLSLSLPPNENMVSEERIFVLPKADLVNRLKRKKEFLFWSIKRKLYFSSSSQSSWLFTERMNASYQAAFWVGLMFFLSGTWPGTSRFNNQDDIQLVSPTTSSTFRPRLSKLTNKKVELTYDACRSTIRP